MALWPVAHIQAMIQNIKPVVDVSLKEVNFFLSVLFIFYVKVTFLMTEINVINYKIIYQLFFLFLLFILMNWNNFLLFY